MQFHEKTFYGFKLQSKHDFKLEITKGHNFYTVLSRYMGFNLCKSSDHALYLYQALPKYIIINVYIRV